MDWRDNILTTDASVRELLENTKTIAVLGIKPETHAYQPAFYVAKYMAEAGYDIIPVPVYYPDVTEILGKPVYRDLGDVPSEIDLLNVFRRSEDIPKHTLEILTKKPKASSSTTTFTVPSARLPRRMWSRARPGVATTTSTPDRKANSCRPIGWPPYTGSTRTPIAFP